MAPILTDKRMHFLIRVQSCHSWPFSSLRLGVLRPIINLPRNNPAGYSDGMQAITAPNIAYTESSLQQDLRRARWLANWLDAKFSFMGIRFGLEGILGLLPVAGDTLGMLAGLYPIYIANRHRLGRGVQIRMILNLLLEWGMGVVPLVGDAADIWYKANLRNLRLLEKAAGLIDVLPIQGRVGNSQ
jgi:hypothetical protein